MYVLSDLPFISFFGHTGHLHGVVTVSYANTGTDEMMVVHMNKVLRANGIVAGIVFSKFPIALGVRLSSPRFLA